MTLVEYLRDKDNPMEASARACLLMKLAAEEIERLQAALAYERQRAAWNPALMGAAASTVYAYGAPPTSVAHKPST